MRQFATVSSPDMGDAIKLELVSMYASEALAQIYFFDLTVRSLNGELTASGVLGRTIRVTMPLDEGGQRYFNGIVTRMSRRTQAAGGIEYQLQLVPELGVLANRSDARVFQEKPVVSVLEEVFARAQADRMPSVTIGKKPTKGGQPWAQCVQYRESDLNFVQRLLEQEGIYYHFSHLPDGHTSLMLQDDQSVVDDDARPTPAFEFRPQPRNADNPEKLLAAWSKVAEMVPGRTCVSDFDFRQPDHSQESRAKDVAGHTYDDAEAFHFPGDFDSPREGDDYATIRAQEMRARHETFEGGTVSPKLRPGMIIKISGHPQPDMNGEFLVVATNFSLINQQSRAGEGSGGAQLNCAFSAIRASVQFRPVRSAPKSAIIGPQTATVVGPEDSEIHTDESGRIRVKFHWDRYAQPHEEASCWIRVAQPWANQGFGFWALPRVGAEVVVQFLDGDPDRPLVIGSVYNGANAIPYPQAANKTRTGLRTHSSPSKEVNDYNELRFEDKKGEEEIFVQAQRNHNMLVKHSATRDVRVNDSLAVGGDRAIHVIGNQDTRVDKDHVTVVQQTLLQLVKGDIHDACRGDVTQSVKGALTQHIEHDLATEVDGDIAVLSTGHDIKASMAIAVEAGTSVDIKAGTTAVIDAPLGITLSCGGSFISLTPAGIFIQGPLLMLNSGGAPLTAMAAKKASTNTNVDDKDALKIGVKEGAPIKPSTLSPKAGSLADAARSGSAFATAA